MRKLLPGLTHWRAFHQDIGHDVDCYHAESEGVTYLLDPLLPEGGIEFLQQVAPPSHIYMTNRLHDRSCADCARAVDATVWCNRHGLHEYVDDPLDVQPFDAGDVLPGGVCTIEVGLLCPDETALLLPIDTGVLAIADSLIRFDFANRTHDGAIGFVPDSLIGDDAEHIKTQTKALYLDVCDSYAFDHVIFAHGEPLIGDAKQQLRSFCDR